MNTIDFAIFIVYMLAVTLFGSSFYKKDKSSSAFVLGNSNFPQWVVSMSILATFISSISFLAIPATAFMSNWNAFVFSLSLPLAAVITVRYFVPIYRKINNPSAYTFLEERFGLWARIYVSTCYLLTQLMRTGTILYLLALPLNAMFGWDILTIILITGVTVTIYSLLGGIEAVMWTDAIQGIVLIVGSLVCLVYIIMLTPGGLGEMIDVGISQSKFSLGSLNLGLTTQTFWVVLIYGLFINLQNFGIDQNYVQRYMTARSDKEAQKAALQGSIAYIPVSLVFFLIGTALFAYYSHFQSELPIEIRDTPDKVFPYFIAHKIPVGITGVLIAAIFAAGMSTISTSINSSATVILYDYYKRFTKKAVLTDKETMRFLYKASLVFGVLGTGIGLAMMNVKSVLDTWWTLASIFSGGMLGIFLLAAFAPKVSKKGAILGVVFGLLVISYMSISPLIKDQSGEVVSWASPFHGYLTIVFGTMTVFLVGFFGMFLFKKEK